MIEETLKSIGLSKNETKIYLALLELGPSLMGHLCAKTKIHRRNAYDSIEMLKDKGFISSTIVNNRNVFEATGPERIIDMLDEKKAGIQEIIPKLLAKQNKKQANVRIYAGLGGRKIIFEDKLKCDEEQLVLGAHLPSEKSERFIENYHNRRIKKNISLRMLFTNNEKAAAKKFKKYKFVTARIMPEDLGAPIAINIWGNKTAILLGSETIEPTSILIEDSGLTGNFRTYFEMLWKLSRPA